MPPAEDALPTKKRIMSVCVRLFLEKGYRKTTIADIVRQADVSNSSFQHFFGAKDGVLTALVRYMFDHQFNMAQTAVPSNLPPMYTYEMGAALQLTLTELNENIRELYNEAYLRKDSLDIIQHATAGRLYAIFGSYQPELVESDFYKLVLGTTGMMRGYSSHPCDEGFTLEQKIHCYVTSELRVYRVPEDEMQKVAAFVLSTDLRPVARQAIEEIFRLLSVHYQFSLDGIPITTD